MGKYTWQYMGSSWGKVLFWAAWHGCCGRSHHRMCAWEPADVLDPRRDLLKVIGGTPPLSRQQPWRVAANSMFSCNLGIPQTPCHLDKKDWPICCINVQWQHEKASKTYNFCSFPEELDSTHFENFTAPLTMTSSKFYFLPPQHQDPAACCDPKISFVRDVSEMSSTWSLWRDSSHHHFLHDFWGKTDSNLL